MFIFLDVEGRGGNRVLLLWLRLLICVGGKWLKPCFSGNCCANGGGGNYHSDCGCDDGCCDSLWW